MKLTEKKHVYVSKIALVICALAIVFTGFAIFTAVDMKNTSQMVYDHPYAVSNDARAMRSRLLDMKRFINSFLVHDYASTGVAEQLFNERYEVQLSAIDTIEGIYLGPEDDIKNLRLVFDELMTEQNNGIGFVMSHSDEEVEAYIEETIYPLYDQVDEALEKIIDYADSQVYALTSQTASSTVVFIILAVSLCIFIILSTLYASTSERKSIMALEEREKELEDALLLAQKAGNAKKDFLSRMSHEIRTPMNVIIGMTTIAGAHVQEPSRIEDCLSKIAYSSRHLLSIINDVLDMSKIEEGKLSLNHQPFEFSQLVESVMAIVYPQTQAKKQEFACEIKGELLETYIGDFMRMNQILINILSNAIKFTPEGGHITLTIDQVSKKDDRAFLRFVVSDTGIGMSEDFLERIFKPFEQANNMTSSKYGGTGLGMAITYNLVELLGGSIHVKSELDQGSTFTVDIPFGIPQDLLSPKEWKLDALNVLVVDDDEDACTHASLLLERMGIQAKWVQSGFEAIQMVFDAHDVYQDYDVCIIDWKMPDLNGIEVTKRIREKLGPDTIIIIISAYDWTDIEEEARAAGANAFVSKPLFASSLYNVLQSIFGVKPKTADVDTPRVESYQGKRFLLVEDNEINREIAVELLSETGAVIECAVDGQDALNQFNASPEGYFDVIFMDIQMPNMDGYQATKEIRRSNHPDAKNVPIFAMTANAFREDVEKCLNAGMNDHIAKPIDMNLVYNVLNKVL